MSDDFSSNENFGLLVTSMEYILVYQKMLLSIKCIQALCVKFLLCYDKLGFLDIRHYSDVHSLLKK